MVAPIRLVSHFGIGFGSDHGTRHLIFEPLTLLEKLAALIPWPRINLARAVPGGTGETAERAGGQEC